MFRKAKSMMFRRAETSCNIKTALYRFMDVEIHKLKKRRAQFTAAV